VTLFAAALAASGRAHADTIPAPSLYLSAYSAPGVGQYYLGPSCAIFEAGVCNLPVSPVISTTTGVDMFGGVYSSYASATDWSYPNPTLQVAINGSGVDGPGDPLASAQLTYSFGLTGGPGVSFNVVPVWASYSIYFTDNDPSDDFEVAGEVSVGSSTTGLQAMSNICGDTMYCDAGSLPDAGFYRLIFCTPGVVESVYMAASVEYEAAQTPSFAAGVYLDPVFTIDPTFLQENPGYSLEFSDGIGDLPDSAPEPATWAMMLAGLGGLGATMRRKRPRRPEAH
jgi:hypothetical protein